MISQWRPQGETINWCGVFTSSNQVRAVWGNLYFWQCSFKSSTNLGKTVSNSFNVAGILEVGSLSEGYWVRQGAVRLTARFFFCYYLTAIADRVAIGKGKYRGSKV